MLADDPQLVRKVRAAITAKIKPTSMVLMEDPKEPWRLLDFQLIEALQILEDEICPHCNHPIWLCRSDNPELVWKTKSYICRGTREIDERNWRKNNPKKRPSKDDSDEWGRVVYPVPEMIQYPGEDKQPLPSRKDFYAGLTIE